MIFKNILTTVRDYFFPDICMSCGKVLETNGKLCANCEEKLSYIDKNKRCLKCGLEKPSCDCVKYIFYFEAVVSVFFNKDSARSIVYKYKLLNKDFYSDYITDKMAEVLNEAYADIEFDYIVPVPTSFKSSNKKGFDHTLILAKGISEKVGIPIKTDIIGVKSFRKAQHKSSFNERFENVKDKYFVKNKVDCGNVLLIDDIKTTGATLNACARELLVAGARRVYCLTALGSAEKKLHKKEDKKF